ncbi:HAD family hydrolase [Pendulispora albinea]|uniref:HAD family hydrolase n=1 Tax=Pendulispora albinea TaxID=2741071 RepID=A0ABZ2LYI3_9BACT
MATASPIFRPRPVYPRLSATEQSELLGAILARCAHEPSSGPPPIVVFDLDGTLMDNRPRTSAILRELAEHWTSREPELAAGLRNADPRSLAYMMTDTLGLLGVTRSDLVTEAQEYWRVRFFRDEHLVHDIPLAGSVSFAKDCYAAGATLVYLTGRDLPHMGLGTFRSLRDLGFPIGVPGTELVLKPEFSMPDEAFKREVAPTLARVGHVIASFDNEPGNCNAFKEVYPHAESVLIDTQHTPCAPPLGPGVRVLADFVR